MGDMSMPRRKTKKVSPEIATQPKATTPTPKEIPESLQLCPHEDIVTFLVDLVLADLEEELS